MVLYHIMPSKRIKKKLRGLLKHCLTSLPSRIGENSESVALKDFTSKSAVRDISFHVKAMHQTYGHKLLPKLTRDHRAYIASKFERTKIKVVAATVEVEGLAALVKGLSAKVQASVAAWCAEQELANVELIAVGELDDVFVAALGFTPPAVGAEVVLRKRLAKLRGAA